MENAEVPKVHIRKRVHGMACLNWSSRPKQLTRAFKRHPHLQTKNRLLEMAHRMDHQGDAGKCHLQKVTGRHTWRGMQET